MDYREYPPPPTLQHRVKVAWTLTLRESTASIEHSATPDGCLELVWRLGGDAYWQRPQPECLIAGLIDRPARLRFSGQAAFVGLRLWPWSWHLLGGRPCREFINDWCALADSGLDAATQARLSTPWAGDWQVYVELFAGQPSASLRRIAVALDAAESVADLSRRCGLSPRALQRWFAREIGIAPRSYLRMLRFQQTFVALQTGPQALAEAAANAGYADQAHMARDFRALAGASASRLRRRAKGPFA